MPRATQPKTSTRKRPARRSSTAPKGQKPAPGRAEITKSPENPPRRTAWLREEQLDRLEALKLQERPRLRKAGLRASVTTLIDEAIEAYLKQHEKKRKRR